MARCLAAFLVCLGLCACGGGGGGSAAPPAPADTTTVAGAVSDGIDRGAPGMFYAVDRSGRDLLVGAAGIQNRDPRTAADPAALFKIASVSKLFLAAAAAKLAYQNQLSLDDTIEYWLPALAARIENADEITVRQLVMHRSGIPDFDSQSGFSWQNAHTDIDVVLAYALDRPADFAPNARNEYSNTNYLLLARILDAALGYSHHSYIQDFILTPLGMNDTYLQLADADTDRLVHGYWDDRDTTLQDYVVPGGSMISTVADTATFVRALARGDLMNDDERDLYVSLYSFGHSGWLPGYQSIARFVPDVDAVVVLFVNQTGDDSEGNIAATYEQIVRVLRAQ